MTRGGFWSRSITLTVSTLPSAEPAAPLLATSAILPFGTMSRCMGRHRSAYRLFVGDLLAINLQERDLVDDGLMASALVLSAEIATCATLSPIAIVSATFMSLPEMVRTVIELSARLVTSARYLSC